MIRTFARVVLWAAAIIPAVAITVWATGCSVGRPPRPKSSLAPTVTVTSPAFGPGQPIPARYTCDGEGISPPLAWRGGPDRAPELALIVDDPDAPGGTYTHWVVGDLPAAVPAVAEGAAPPTAAVIPTSSGHRSYAPLCPPSGTHHYRFTMYALSAPADLTGHSLEGALHAIGHSTLAWGRLTGTYH